MWVIFGCSVFLHRMYDSELVYLFASVMKETTERISIKFRIGSLHDNAQSYFILMYMHQA
jgi:hypothetical protein